MGSGSPTPQLFQVPFQASAPSLLRRDPEKNLTLSLPLTPIRPGSHSHSLLPACPPPQPTTPDCLLPAPHRALRLSSHSCGISIPDKSLT